MHGSLQTVFCDAEASVAPELRELCEQEDYMITGVALNQGRAGQRAAQQLAALEEERRRRIAQAAYFKSEHRGFAPGMELEDWLEAESEIDDALRPLPSY